nr:hypothetical protein [Pandoravirus belohorizontensis]
MCWTSTRARQSPAPVDRARALSPLVYPAIVVSKHTVPLMRRHLGRRHRVDASVTWMRVCRGQPLSPMRLLTCYRVFATILWLRCAATPHGRPVARYGGDAKSDGTGSEAAT